MNFIQQTLASCALFADLTPAELSEVSTQAHFFTRSYARDQVVAFEEDECTALGILASGGIHIQRIFPSGKIITIETFKAGDSFGEALMFADHSTYPATLISKEEATVLYISREDVIELCRRYPHFLSRFMATLSNRILLLNRKIKNLSLGTVRQKVTNYILEERHNQKSDQLQMTSARHELADFLGIPRPSLSRELIAMKAEGWIDFDRHTILILDREKLESALRS